MQVRGVLIAFLLMQRMPGSVSLAQAEQLCIAGETRRRAAFAFR